MQKHGSEEVEPGLFFDWYPNLEIAAQVAAVEDAAQQITAGVTAYLQAVFLGIVDNVLKVFR